MSQLTVKKGSTDRSVYLYIVDSTDGTPEQGVNYATSGLALWYRRVGAAATAITPAELAALTTAHTDGGIIHIDDGLYRVDVPDAAFATGVSEVTVGGSCTGMIVLPIVVQLVNYDPEDGVRLGLTALPNAAADAAGGLAISDAGGLDLDALATNAARLTSDRASYIDLISTRLLGTIAAGTHNPQGGDAYARVGAPAGASIAADIATTNGRLTATRAGYLDSLVELTVARMGALTDWIDGGRLDLLLDAVKSKTDALPADPADESALEAAVAGLATLIADCAVPGDAMGISAGGVSALTDAVLDGTLTLADLLVICASLAAKVSGAPSGPFVYRNPSDTKNVITVTPDANGNRTAVVFTP